MEMNVISISRNRDELHAASEDQEISTAAISFTPSLADAELSVVMFIDCEWNLPTLVCIGARQPLRPRVRMMEHQEAEISLIDEIGRDCNKVIT